METVNTQREFEDMTINQINESVRTKAKRAQIANMLSELQVVTDDVVNIHDELVDALFTALPFVEDSLEDECYKRESVNKVINKIRNVLKKVGAA